MARAAQLDAVAVQEALDLVGQREVDLDRARSPGSYAATRAGPISAAWTACSMRSRTTDGGCMRAE